MIEKGIATFSLDYGKCPKWLFERMVKLSRRVIFSIVDEYGPDEFIKRISDPVWFQSLGTVLAFDWNSSGLTTILTAALKEAIRGEEKALGVFICGGKGKTSRKTPEEIKSWGEILALPELNINNLVYNSKMAAKVDSSLIQDGFQIYHHAFFFSRNGSWSVVQQGMNVQNQTARRYHWYSKKLTDLVCEPHSGIISQVRAPALNLVARESEETRQVSTELVRGSYPALIKDIKILRRHSDDLSKTISLNLKFKDRAGFGDKEKLRGQKITYLKLENKEFTWHPVLKEDFSKSKYLEKILAKICDRKPKTYEELISIEGVGPKTIRALALVAEIIYGAKPSYEDPARYSFAHGGKDGTPYPVDCTTYDEVIKYTRKD